MQKIIKFGTVRVKRGYELGSGAFRTVYNCDYTCRGKKYVLKYADDAKSRKQNQSEYTIYKFVKGTEFQKYFPEFRKITSDGTWLLVERCEVAGDDYGEASEECYFPHGLLHDDHNENWGFTLKGQRRVILDMAVGASGYRSIKQTVREALKQRKAA